VYIILLVYDRNSTYNYYFFVILSRYFGVFDYLPITGLQYDLIKIFMSQHVTTYTSDRSVSMDFDLHVKNCCTGMPCKGRQKILDTVCQCKQQWMGHVLGMTANYMKL